MNHVDWKATRGHCSMIDDFCDLEPIGSGTYGVVYRAVRRSDRTKVVALKEIRMEKEKDGLPITTVRELKLLSRLSHPNLVCLEEVAVGPVSDQFFLVFEYATHDFTDILDSSQFMVGKTLSLANIKTLMLQLLKAVDYLHTRWVIHRDIKVSNLLYFDETGTMKLADFGLARSFTHFAAEPLTPETVTLWYRSPEILFNAAQYGPSADMWSVGCVFAEFVAGHPLFPGASFLDQLNRMTLMLGSFRETWPEVDELPEFSTWASSNSESQNRSSTRFIETFKPSLGILGLDLLQRMLSYNPKTRITAAAAIEHPFFNAEPLPSNASDMPSFSNIQRKPPKELK